jgi:hypothetical protein
MGIIRLADSIIMVLLDTVANDLRLTLCDSHRVSLERPERRYLLVAKD